MLRKEVLIVGADDSNHAADNNVKGEIDVALFSYNPKDAIIIQHKNRRDFRSSFDWLSALERDYRFAILKSPKYRSRRDNLVGITPILIGNFVEERGIYVERLEVYLDGPLLENERIALIHAIQKRTGIEEIVARGFVKKRTIKGGGIIKGPYCPTIVYHADTWAHALFSTPFDKLSSDPKLVTIL